ncbi:hypothetical protein DEJ39_01190 [Bacteroidetes bacterium SCGC AAA795-G10]|nr:hypothetical protein DEJ39_01190 [Bacteroidetes bacterium SCGC AAA795-G10]
MTLIVLLTFFRGFSQTSKKQINKFTYSRITVSEAENKGLPVIKNKKTLTNKTSISTNKVFSGKSKKSFNKVPFNLKNKRPSPQLSLNKLKPNKIVTKKISSSTSKTLTYFKKKEYEQISIKYSKNKVPRFIRSNFIGDISSSNKKSKRLIVKDYLEELKDILMIKAPNDEFEIKEETKDKFGLTHLKFKQVFNKIPIYAKEIVVHLDKKGYVKSLNGSYISTPEKVNTTAQLDVEKVREKLSNIFGKSIGELEDLNDSIEPVLVIYEKKNQLYLSWYITIYSSYIDRWNLFIDDKTGAILDKIYTTCTIDSNHNHDSNFSEQNILNNKKKNMSSSTGTGVDLNGIERNLNTFFFNDSYWLIDTTKPSYDSNLSNELDQKGAIQTLKYNSNDDNYYYQENQNNTFDDPSLVSAHYNASIVYDYFFNTFQRNSLDGNGGSTLSVTNIKENGIDVDNAFWNGRFIGYGNGKTGFKPLAGSLDVAAHEFSHGIVQATAGLEYKDESGALNESFADIFGVMVDRDDWTLGEEIVNLEYYPNGVLRSLEEPVLGYQPSHYDDYNIEGGVHTNSGIPNKAFYIIASSIGKDKAEQIYYRALTTYLTRSSDFLDLRIGLEESAIDIYGSNSAELISVKEGLDAVGILFEEVESASKIEVDGTDYILSYDTDPSNQTTFYISDPFAEEFVAISETEIMTKPSISSDGYFLIFITEENNLNAISLESENIYEYVFDDSGIWNSVAISKDKSKIALTTTDSDDKNIYIYDFINSKWKTFELYTPTTAQGGLKSDQILYADALEWDNRSESIIFDQLNRIKRGNGEDLEYWDIGIMEVWDSEKNRFGSGNIFRLYSQIPENVNIAYPSISKTTNNILAFDYIEEIDGEFYPYVVLLDIEKGDFNFFENNSLDYSIPSFATLDNQIIYTKVDQEGSSDIYSRQISDFLVPSDQESLLIPFADYGIWFNQGQRDFDKDGVLDDIDRCPNSPAGVPVDDDGCAVSQKDTDQDGIYDNQDNCVEVPNENQIDTDNDGIGNTCDEDDDGDGIEDERDLCPDTPLDSKVDINGCKIFSLPKNNFSLSVKEISCVGNDDGEIVFSAEDKSYDYLASISNKSSLKLERSNSKNNFDEVCDNFDYTECTPKIYVTLNDPQTFDDLSDYEVSNCYSNVQSVQTGEELESFYISYTYTCNMNYTMGLGSKLFYSNTKNENGLYYNYELLSSSQMFFEPALYPLKPIYENKLYQNFFTIAFLGDREGEICDGTFSCRVAYEPGTTQRYIFKGEVKDNAIPGSYIFQFLSVMGDDSVLPGTQFGVNSQIIISESSDPISDSTGQTNESSDIDSTDDNLIKLNSLNNHSGNFKNLKHGTYDICIKVVGQEDYEQCFELTVKEPEPLTATSKVNKTDKAVEFNLSGSKFYYINHNNEIKVVDNNNPTIRLKPGLNHIEISTDKSCQGKYLEEIFVSEEIQFYPNPTINYVNFYINGQDNFIDIKIFDSSGKLNKSCMEEISSSRKVEVDFSDLFKGVYIVKLKGQTVEKTIKIIKE